MSKIKFRLDDVSKDFNLIAIRSDVEDYRMVYFLNKKLNINLSRRNNDIVFYKDENKYSIYDYTDESRYLKWIFFSNKSFSQKFIKDDNFTLFSNENFKNNEIRFIKELNSIDYFLTIENVENIKYIEKILTKISEISIVITCFETSQGFKNKENLIFS
tara:strand:+ start:198 stop:674 length:477 start_codon:yes stop_codon:yes gene_type:complete